MANFAGLDWGGVTHAVCVINAAGGVATRFEVTHDAVGLAELIAKLRRIGPPAELSVAIERPTGLVVDALVKAGHPVVPIHPNVVKACRPRYRAAGGKSDPGDAYMLADILRTDGNRFRPLVPQSDNIKALRALVRGRDDLVEQRVALANQLRSLLEGFWPGAAVIFADIDSAISLSFISKFPTPASARHLGEKSMAKFMKANAYCGRRSAVELLARLQAAPSGLAGPTEARASGEMVSAQLRVLIPLVAAIARLTVRIESSVAELPEGKIIMSFPRAGQICAAQIVVELGDVRERFLSEDQLAAEAGVCPVTHASGKTHSVVFRRACNKNLRAAITCFADNSRHASLWAAEIYRNAKARGCKHAHAVRILARAWVRIIWRAWQDEEFYDLTKHVAAAKFIAS